MRAAIYARILLVTLCTLLAVAASASAECKWLLWGQDESFWSYKLLNIIPGPTRGNAYIVSEYDSQDSCGLAAVQHTQMQIDRWKLQQDIKEFGGLRTVTSYACVPLPLKPAHIDHTGWK